MMTPHPLPTLREKLGQMLIAGFRGCRVSETDSIVRDIREHHLGGIILFDQEMADRTLPRRNIESPNQLQALVAFLQAQARLPLLVSIDQEGGRVNRLKPEYGFPQSLSHEELGRIDNPAETFQHARATARTLAGLGINLNLAPVVDLDLNPDNPIIGGKGRSFSSDPERTSVHAAEFVKAHRAEGVLSCAKHFPGHGSAGGDTHLGLVDVTHTWQEQELIPYQRLIAAECCDAIMSAHVFHAGLDPNRPATLSPAVLTGLLRERLQFGGAVLSDDMEMKAISSQYGLEKSVPAAVAAGIDILCFGNNLHYDPDIVPKAVDILARAVDSGQIAECRINASYERVMTMKRAVNLLA